MPPDVREQLRAALGTRYAVEREIGQGGMATVYLARDLKHDRPVALKVLDPELGAVLGVERFLTEIRVTANLQHPHLLPLYDSGEAGGLLFYVMPYVDGESLRARLDREKQLPVDEAVRIAVAVAGALEYAHGHGVIHRDLKPENILLQAGQPLVADFGIALAVSAAGGHRITQTGISLGTPQYMSPEQATGDRTVDARSDLYSLAAVAYEMLVGEPPHTGGTSQAIFSKLLTDRPRPIRAARETVPPHVAAVVERALARLPADRFATAREFAEALEGRRPVAPPSGEVAASQRATRRSIRAWQGATAVAVAVAVVAGWFALHRRAQPPDLQVARQLTFDGDVVGTAISPDGKWLAYVTDDCGSTTSVCGEGLNVREVDGAQAVRIASAPYIAADPVWSADGSELAYIAARDSSGRSVFLTERLGGSTRRIPVRPTDIAFRPDGRLSAIVTSFPGGRVHQVVRDYDPATLAPADSFSPPPGLVVTSLEYGLPGGRILATMQVVPQYGMVAALLSPAGRLLDSMPVNYGVRWDPAASAVLAYRNGPGIGLDLMGIPVVGGRLERDRKHVVLGQVPLGTTPLASGLFDVSHGGRVALLKAQTTWKLEELRLDRQPRRWTEFTTRTGFLQAWQVSPDGRSLLVTATDNLGDNLYVFPIDGGPPRAVTSSGGTRGYARWSPDGRRILYFEVTPGANPKLAVVSADGGPERELRSTVLAVWLSDDEIGIPGTSINSGLIIDTTGAVVDSFSVNGASPYGPTQAHIAVDPHGRVAYWSGEASAVAIADLRKNSVVLRHNAVALVPVEWLADGSLAVATMAAHAGATAEPVFTRLMRLPPGDGAPVFLADLPPGCVIVTIDRAGRHAFCTVASGNADVWLADQAGRSGWPGATGPAGH